MLQKSLVVACLLAAVPAYSLANHLAPLSPPTAISLNQDVTSLVAGQLKFAETQSREDVWETARSLRNAATDLGHAEAVDAALDAELKNNANPGALLAAAAARLVGPAPDLNLINERIKPLLQQSNLEWAAGAAELLGRRIFRDLGVEERASLANELQNLADDGDKEPELRIAAAISAYEIARGIDKGKARSRLRSFLGSSDPELRSQGALALARIGDEVRGDLETELARLAELPGDTGRLADTYLKLEATRKMHEEKYRKLQSLYNSQSTPENLQKVSNLLEMIHEGHIEGERFDDEELIDAALNGMLGALDEHSSYMTPEEYKAFSVDLLDENYGGIGAYVRNDPADNIFTITRPIYSGPAYKAGLATDDKIVRIDDWPTLGNETDEVIKRLKGKPGTMVKLYIWRRGMDPGLISRPTKDMIVEIERAQISVPATAYQMLPGNIGLVELRSFNRNATQDVAMAIDALLKEGMQGLIFDLRFNGGGLLSEAAGVSDLFLPKGVDIVTTEPRRGSKETLKSLNPAFVPEDMPVVCLVNRYSASASEIVSGALQDHERATILGERSFGKGSVQNLFSLFGYQDDIFEDENGNHKWDPWEALTRDFNGNGEFDFAPHVRLTIARYLLPSWRSIHREFDREDNLINPGGVVPDVQSHGELIEGWRLVERRQLNDTTLIRDYVDNHWDTHHEEFVAFAYNDEKNPTLYPGFDSFFASLDTPLDPDDVRYLIRNEIRRRVQDERGGAFPIGDFVEDVQVQDAVRALFDALNESISDVPAFAATFTTTRNEDGSHTAPAVAEENTRRDNLMDATKALIAARDAGADLSPEQLTLMIELLEGLSRD